MTPAIPEIHGIEITCQVREQGSLTAWTFSYEDSALRLTIEKGVATFAFKCPLSSFEDAERRIYDFVRSWEGDLLLQTGSQRRDFTISGCRAPGHGGRAYAYMHGTVGGALAEANTRRQTPWRRHRYWHLPLISSLVARYEAYRYGREQLTVLGFLCLSALETAFGGRQRLATALQIDSAVLRELARLVSTVGTYGSARKISRHHELREFTASEVHWLETAIREILLRAGQSLDEARIPSRLSLQGLPRL